MGYKLQRYNGSSWDNLLKDLYVEVDNTNWTSTTLSAFLDEVSTSLDGKESRNVVKVISNYTASAFDVILVDTTSPVTITLPVAPSRGDKVKIIDTLGNANLQNITVNRNTNNINGSAEDILMDVDFSAVLLIYDDSTNGWHLDVTGSYFGSDISEVNDNFITLNADVVSGTPVDNCGIIVSRGDSNNAILQWDESSDKWTLTTDGVTFHEILTTDNIGSLVSHSDLSDLDADDHTQYVHNTIDRTISATHTFNPDATGTPFEVGANATKQMVSGLNSNYVNGLLLSSQGTTPTDINANDIWVQEV